MSARKNEPDAPDETKKKAKVALISGLRLRFRRLHAVLFGMLRRRLETLFGLGALGRDETRGAKLTKAWKTYFAVVLMLATLGVCIRNLGSTDIGVLFGLWFLFTLTIVFLGLRGRGPRRQFTHRRYHPVIHWTGLIAALLGYVIVGIIALEFDKKFKIDREILVIPIFVFLVVATAFSAIIFHSFSLIYISKLLYLLKIRKFHIGQYLTPGNIFAIPISFFLLFVMAALIISDISESYIFGLLVFAGIITILTRHVPWRREVPGMVALAPHLPLIISIVVGWIWVVFAITMSESFADRTFIELFPLPALLWFPVLILCYVLGPLFLLRKGLVEKWPEGGKSTALSIYPDPAVYVDRDDYSAQIQRLIRESDGGVIGVTGVRGAGKSALLGHVLSKFDKRFCTVWMTAPVSHQPGTSFLMSVCRRLCEKAIENAEPVLRGRSSDTWQALAELWRRNRMFAFGIIIFAGLMISVLPDKYSLDLGEFVGISSVPQLNTAATSSSNAPRLPFPSSIRIQGRISATNKRPLALAAFRAVLAAERRAIDRLIRQIPRPRDVEAQKLAKFHLIVPIPLVTGFHLVPLENPSGSRGIVSANKKWLPKIIANSDTKFSKRVVPYFALMARGIIFASSYVNYYSIQSRSQLRILLTARFGVGSAKSATDFRDFRRLLYFHHQLRGLPNKSTGLFRLLSEQSALYFDRLQSLRVGYSRLYESFIGLDLLRGHPAIQSHLRVFTADLRNLLQQNAADVRKIIEASKPATGRASKLFTSSTTASPKKKAKTSPELPTSPPAELVSLILLRAYHENEVGLVFSQKRLEILHRILTQYRDVLDARTINPAGPLGQSKTISMTASILQPAWDGLAKAWPVLVVIPLILMLGALWRLGNFLVRGLMNFRLLTLVRESDDFIEYLNYSEGRESSSSLSFKGLKVGGSRKLTARSLTLQGLTDRYMKYVEKLRKHYNGKLILVIDELDKIPDPNMVKGVLQEIKGALFQKGCYYLLSISEDAANAFRGRLIEGRDIFESTFDDVVEIGRMRPETAKELVRKRLKAEQFERLDENSILMMAVFASGIPRDIVRNLRTIVLEREDQKARIDPKQVGVRLYRQTVEEWKDELTGLGATADDIDVLHRKAENIVGLANRAAGRSTWPSTIRRQLNECLRLLDPHKLRRTFAPNAQAATIQAGIDEQKNNGDDFAEDEWAALYRAVVGQVQGCVRLIVLDEVLRRFWLGEPEFEKFAVDAIAALRIVSDRPAVAEDWVAKIRRSKTRAPRTEPVALAAQ